MDAEGALAAINLTLLSSGTCPRDSYCRYAFAWCVSLCVVLSACGDAGTPSMDIAAGVDTVLDADGDVPRSAPVCTRVTELSVREVRADSWSFDSSDEAVSLVISAAGKGSEWAAITRLHLDGDEWLTPNWWSGLGADLHLGCCIRAAAWPGIALAALPSSPGRLIGSGTWDFQASGEMDSEPTVFARYGIATGQLQLPLVLHGTQQDMESAQAAWVKAASVLLQASADISLQVIDTVDLDTTALVEARGVQYQPANSAVQNALHVVLVPEASTAGPLADGIDGLSVVGGPVQGGAIFLRVQQTDISRTLAHEICHYLGLWHLTETAQPDIHDPLSDTPFYDANNLMSAEQGGGSELSPQQVDIIRRHPLLRGATNRCVPN